MSVCGSAINLFLAVAAVFVGLPADAQTSFEERSRIKSSNESDSRTIRKPNKGLVLLDSLCNDSGDDTSALTLSVEQPFTLHLTSMSQPLATACTLSVDWKAAAREFDYLEGLEGIANDSA